MPKFHVTLPDDDRPHTVYAKTKAQAAEWIDAILKRWPGATITF